MNFLRFIPLILHMLLQPLYEKLQVFHILGGIIDKMILQMIFFMTILQKFFQRMILQIFIRMKIPSYTVVVLSNDTYGVYLSSASFDEYEEVYKESSNVLDFSSSSLSGWINSLSFTMISSFMDFFLKFIIVRISLVLQLSLRFNDNKV